MGSLLSIIVAPVALLISRCVNLKKLSRTPEQRKRDQARKERAKRRLLRNRPMSTRPVVQPAGGGSSRRLALPATGGVPEHPHLDRKATKAALLKGMEPRAPKASEGANRHSRAQTMHALANAGTVCVSACVCA